MSAPDIVSSQPEFEFFGGQLSAWKVGSTPQDRGYIIEVKPGFASDVRVPWMHDLRIDLLEPAPAHGTEIRLSDEPGRPGGGIILSTHEGEQTSVELIGDEVIEVNHPTGIRPQAPAFFRATILGTRFTSKLLNEVNAGPDTVGASMAAFAKRVEREPDTPVEKIELSDGSIIFRGNPAQVADVIKRSAGGPNKMSRLLDEVAKLQGRSACNVEDV